MDERPRAWGDGVGRGAREIPEQGKAMVKVFNVQVT